MPMGLRRYYDDQEEDIPSTDKKPVSDARETYSGMQLVYMDFSTPTDDVIQWLQIEGAKSPISNPKLWRSRKSVPLEKPPQVLEYSPQQ